MSKRGGYRLRTLTVMAEWPKLRAEGMSLKQIGERFGISAAHVNQIVRKTERAERDARRRRGESVPIPGMPPGQYVVTEVAAPIISAEPQRGPFGIIAHWLSDGRLDACEKPVPKRDGFYPARALTIMQLHAEGLSPVDIGARVGIGAERVRQILRKAARDADLPSPRHAA
jgi:DNA-binding CsgD family transcriptional regulator